MAYFWVNQKQTWKQESEGGYLWAPILDKNGSTQHHWETMLLVRPGDIIFSYVGGSIRASSVAKSAAYDFPQPEELTSAEADWNPNGRRIDVVYEFLNQPLEFAAFYEALQPFARAKNSPIRSDGRGANMGYLYQLSPKAGRLLLDRMRLHETDAADLLEDGVSRSTPESTQRSALVKSRIGQGQFRADVLGMWHSRCAVTGLDLRQLVRASHIKPWRDSNNSERLDPYNGLPLAPGYDAAFDAGLITFKNDGEVVVSDSLPRACLAKLGINITDRITGLQEKHLSYLDYHRSEVFTQSM